MERFPELDKTAALAAKAIRGAANSVTHDATALVSNDVSAGARLEAGLNLAADVSSFAVGPEDAVLERGAVFGVKEAVAHGPQEIEAGGAVFRALASRLEKAGHVIVNSSAGRGLLETGSAMYKTLERGEAAGAHTIDATFHEALNSGKSLVVHAPHLTDEAFRAIDMAPRNELAMKLQKSALLTASPSEIEHAVAAVERTGLRKALHVVDDGAEKLAKRIDTAKTISETAQKVVAHPAVSLALGSAATFVGAHVHEAAATVSESARGAVHAGREFAQHAEHELAATTKVVTTAVEAWSPQMAFSDFKHIIDHVAGKPESLPHKMDTSQTIERDQPAIKRPSIER